MDAVSGWWYVTAGLGIGVAIGLSLACAMQERMEGVESSPEPEGPGLAKRVVDKIPTRVKVAAVGGAVKGGGKEAYREIKQKIAERRHGRERRQGGEYGRA